jgi:hypothetical protein
MSLASRAITASDLSSSRRARRSLKTLKRTLTGYLGEASQFVHFESLLIRGHAKYAGLSSLSPLGSILQPMPPQSQNSVSGWAILYSKRATSNSVEKRTQIIRKPSFVARPLFAPELSVDERSGRTDQVSARIANLPDDGRMDWLWKDLIDGSIFDKSYCVPGLRRSPFDHFCGTED